MGLEIHEHDLLPMGTNSQFLQCRTCDAAYCILCGERITTIDEGHEHTVEKCITSRQVKQGYQEIKKKLQLN